MKLPARSGLVGLLLVALSALGCEPTKSAVPPGSAPASPTVTAAPPDTTDWPLFRGDASGTGVSHARLAPPLALLWKFKPADTAFEATAAIVGDQVFVGDADKTFYALDLKTGAMQWTFPGDRGFLAAPAVRNGRVFIGDSGGTFHCLRADNGHEVWKRETKGEINSSANFFEDNVLFGSQDGTLYCLRCEDGAVVWKYTIEAEGGIQSSPTLADKHVFFAGCDGKLHIIEVIQGKDVGTLDIGDPTLSTPAIVGDFAYFGTEGGNFFSVEWRKPKIQWTYRNPRSGAAYRSSAAVIDDLVLIAGRSKLINGLNRSDGEKLWNVATGGRVDSSPVVVDQIVYLGSADGRLYALDMKTGRVAWKYDAGGSFLAGPAVARSRLVVGNENGTLYCFGPAGSLTTEARRHGEEGK